MVNSGHSANFFGPKSRWWKGRGSQIMGPQRNKDTSVKWGEMDNIWKEESNSKLEWSKWEKGF